MARHPLTILIGLTLIAALAACDAHAAGSPSSTPAAATIPASGSAIASPTTPASGSVAASATLAAPSAVVPASKGEILFCSNRDRAAHTDGIFVMHADGSNVRPLSITPGAEDWMPTLSPDGTRIAFGSNRLGDVMAIYLMNPDGSRQTRITDNQFSSYRPSWSPDGKRIVYAGFETGELFLMNADGSGQARLTSGRSGHPSWAPSGQAIAFQTEATGTGSISEIALINADGSGRTDLTKDARVNEFPSWSPDGKRIAFDSKRGDNTDIWVIDVKGKVEQRLTTDAAVDEWPAWSPDGRMIAFARHESADKSEIYVMNADGSGQTRVSTGPIDFCPSWH
jgi:TolB protein